jgi:hypothetical protein
MLTKYKCKNDCPISALGKELNIVLKTKRINKKLLENMSLIILQKISATSGIVAHSQMNMHTSPQNSLPKNREA